MYQSVQTVIQSRQYASSILDMAYQLKDLKAVYDLETFILVSYHGKVKKY